MTSVDWLCPGLYFKGMGAAPEPNRGVGGEAGPPGPPHARSPLLTSAFSKLVPQPMCLSTRQSRRVACLPGPSLGSLGLAETSVLSCVPPSCGGQVLGAARGDRAALSEKWADPPALWSAGPSLASVDLVPCLPRSCLLSWPHRCTSGLTPPSSAVRLAGWPSGRCQGGVLGGLLHGWGGQGAVTCPGIGSVHPALGQREGTAEKAACSPALWVPRGVWAALVAEMGPQAASLTSAVSWAGLCFGFLGVGSRLGRISRAAFRGGRGACGSDGEEGHPLLGTLVNN